MYKKKLLPVFCLMMFPAMHTAKANFDVLVNAAASRYDDLEKAELIALTKQAQNGDAAAQTALGLRYEKGEGAEQNYTEASVWYWKAALQKNPEALYRVGNFYYQGVAFTKNTQEAIKFWWEAARLNHPRAQNNIGYCFEVWGQLDLARKLYELSAQKGCSEGIKNLNRFFL